MAAAKHDRRYGGVAAASEAAVPSEAATQVASDGTPASESDPRAPGSESSRVEERAGRAVPGPEADDDGLPEGAELDLDALVARAEKADEYLQLAQRTKADFENYRRRAAREAAAAQSRGVVKLARELLPAIDNLDRALAAASTTSDEDLAAGVKLVYDELVAALGRAGIDPFSPEGEPFDPQHHEAVAQLPATGAEPGTVLDVYQRGYRLGDAVIRPARVSVAG